VLIVLIAPNSVPTSNATTLEMTSYIARSFRICEETSSFQSVRLSCVIAVVWRSYHPTKTNSLSTDTLDGSSVFRVAYSRPGNQVSCADIFFPAMPVGHLTLANCRPSRLPQHTQNRPTQLALQVSACRWNLRHCSTLPLRLFYLFGRETSLLVFSYYPTTVRTWADDVTHATHNELLL